MKQALRYIPTEVWVDILCFPWISRKKLGQFVDKLSNRYFEEILQYCLHDRGKRMLAELLLYKETIIPQTEMPGNIKFFENIRIYHFDSSTLDFLRRISGLFNSGVNLHFEYFGTSNLTKLGTILDHLTPLFHGINSLAFDQSAIPLVEQYFAAKLAQVKKLILANLYTDDDGLFDPATNQAFNFILNWLTSEDRDPAEPKLLEIYFFSEVRQFSMAVQQQFQSAKRPSTFVIKFHCHEDVDFDFQLNMENNIGERLHGQFDKDACFWILRHQADSPRTKLKGWAKGTVGKLDQFSRIEFFHMTIGQIDANAGTDEADDADAEEDGLSTSKKPKMTQ